MDSRKLKLVLNTLLILAFLVVTRDYVVYKKKSRGYEEQVAALEDEIALLRSENAVILDRVSRLESDPGMIERMARERLGMLRPGEEVVLPDTGVSAPNPSAGSASPTPQVPMSPTDRMEGVSRAPGTAQERPTSGGGKRRP